MKQFPIFVSMKGIRVVLAGGGGEALSKLRLLLKTPAQIDVFAENAAPDIKAWHSTGKLKLTERALIADDLVGATLFTRPTMTQRLTTNKRLGRATTVFSSISSMIRVQILYPRAYRPGPLTVAIGTEGTAPMLARKLKAEWDAKIPQETGAMLDQINAFRDKVAVLPNGPKRRAFYREIFADEKFATLDAETRQERLESVLQKIAESPPEPPVLAAVEIGQDGLSVSKRGLRAINDADCVIFTREAATTAVTERARREADILHREAGEVDATTLAPYAHPNYSTVFVTTSIDDTDIAHLKHVAEKVQPRAFDFQHLGT